jgi:lipocalin
MKNIVILLCLICAFSCQNPNYCKSYDILLDINLYSIKGDWYPLYVSSNIAEKYDCYSLKLNIIENLNESNGKKLELHWINKSQNIDNIINLKLSKHSNSFIPDSNNFKLLTVIDTDYNSYMLAVVCLPGESGNVYQAFLFSRYLSISDELTSRVKDLMTSKFTLIDWVKVKLDQC